MLLALALALLVPSASWACAGDCDWSGQVGVSDLVTMVNVALGHQPVARCAAGDGDQRGDISVSEIVTAVNAALSGCSPVAGTSRAAATLSLARALPRLSILTPAISLAYDGAGGSTPCELGGFVSGICDDSAPGQVRSTVSTSDCHDHTHETPLGYYGSASVSGQGQCPDVLLPVNVRFDFSWNVVNETLDGMPLLDSRIDGAVTLRQLLLGASPCSIKGGVSTLDGDMTFTSAGGSAVAAHFDATSARTDLADFAMEYGCEPLTVIITADGALRLRDTFGSGPLTVDAWGEGLVATIDRSTRTFTIEGDVKGHCFDGVAHISTMEPLTFLVGESCFSAGKLRIETPAGATVVAINADTSIDIDADADGTPDAHYESCGALPATCDQ